MDCSAMLAQMTAGLRATKQGDGGGGNLMNGTKMEDGGTFEDQKQQFGNSRDNEKVSTIR